MQKRCPISFHYAFSHGAGYIVPPQSHFAYELVYYVKGSGNTTVGGSSFPFHQGSFTLTRPGTVHSEHHATAGNVMFIIFQADVPDELPNHVFHDSEDRIIETLLRDIFNELQERRQGYTEILELRLRELMIKIGRLSTPSTEGKSDITDFAVRYIREYYSTPIDWKDLASFCNYSYSHFRFLFKETMGVSPSQYLLGCRLDAAKQLLCETSLSCTEIAYRCGFPNNAKFSSYFKKAMGTSPKAWRLGATKHPVSPATQTKPSNTPPKAQKKSPADQ